MCGPWVIYNSCMPQLLDELRRSDRKSKASRKERRDEDRKKRKHEKKEKKEKDRKTEKKDKKDQKAGSDSDSDAGPRIPQHPGYY